MNKPLTQSLDKLHPEIRKQVLRTPSLPLTSPYHIAIKRLLFRLLTRPQRSHLRACSKVAIGSQYGLVYQPKLHSGRGIFWIHGGGHLVGTPHQLVDIAVTMGNRLGATVVMPSYRLAPEHCFPADLDDCYRAWQWVCDSVDVLSIDPKKMIVAGNSAGGGLAASLVQRLYDEAEPLPAAQVLYYPMLDDRTASNRDLDEPAHYIWNNGTNCSAWSAYLGEYNIAAKALPDYASPARRDDLSGLPPAWIGVGDLDLFCDEDISYHSRLQAANVDTELNIVKGVPHAFEMLVPNAAVARQFQQSVVGFVERYT